jgi:hypothetical protein
MGSMLVVHLQRDVDIGLHYQQQPQLHLGLRFQHHEAYQLLSSDATFENSLVPSALPLGG